MRPPASGCMCIRCLQCIYIYTHMHTALSFCTDRCHRLARCVDLLFQRASTTISMYVSIGGLEEFATLGKKHLHTIIARRTLQDQVHERVWTASAFLQLRFQPATAAAAHLFSYIVMLVCSKFHVEFQMGACTCSRRSPPPPNRLEFPTPSLPTP